MIRLRSRLVLAALVTGSVTLAFVPIARAGDMGITPSTEGWYQPNPTCAQTTGCLTTGSLPAQPPAQPPAASPYPARTMHVGYASQSETARAYLAFPLVGITGTVTDAVLDVPLDTAPADGDLQSATAKIQACLVTGPINAVDASISQPPSSSCDTHAGVSYVATPFPHLHADLSPLLLDLPNSTGLVLLPDATKVAPSDGWRVVFSAHDRTDAAKTAPALLTLTVSEEQVISTPENPAVELPAVDVPTDTGLPPLPVTGFVAPPAPLDIAPATAPVTAPLQQVPAARTITVGYAYPIVWVLPLVFLVLVPLAAKALTKDLAAVPTTV